jgi:hypothetical protein
MSPSSLGGRQESMQGSSLNIVFFEPRKTRSIREVELEKAAIRSHAARVSHHRLREQRNNISGAAATDQLPRYRSQNQKRRGLTLLLPRTVGAHDPFSSYAGSNLPELCLKVTHSGEQHAPDKTAVANATESIIQPSTMHTLQSSRMPVPRLYRASKPLGSVPQTWSRPCSMPIWPPVPPLSFLLVKLAVCWLKDCVDYILSTTTSRSSNYGRMSQRLASYLLMSTSLRWPFWRSSRAT